MKPMFEQGWIVGTGSAINVQLGWIPDYVTLVNSLGANPAVNHGHPRQKNIVYTSESGEIKPGMKLIGATSGATALVLQVIRDTGTVAAGDAAGWIIIDADTETGTFASESAYFEGSATLNDLSIVASVTHGAEIILAVATEVGITAYLGTEAANSKGFSIDADISVDGELMSYNAWRFDN